MLDIFQDQSVGVQVNSLRSSNPRCSFSKGTRDQWGKVHISHEHDNLTSNRDSPGPVYDVKSTIGQSRAVKIATSTKRCFSGEDTQESSIDILGVIPDGQKWQYPGTKSVHFGSDSRDVIKNATILKHHPQAFMGTHSPGPAAYGLPDRIGKSTRMISLGVKTRPLGSTSQTPACVGPGCYSVCGGKNLPVQPIFSFGKSKQRPEPRDGNTCAGLYEIEVPGSIGRQPSSTKRTSPGAVLGSQTRAQWGSVVSFGDSAVNKPVCRIPHPTLPVQFDVIKYSS